MCDEQATKQEVRSMEVVAKTGPVENLIYDMQVLFFLSLLF